MTGPVDNGGDRFIEPTTRFWQKLLEPQDPTVAQGPPYRYGYPAQLPDGRWLVLPLRPLPDGERAVASLIANQASFAVIEALSEAMAQSARRAGAEQVVGQRLTSSAAFISVRPRLSGHGSWTSWNSTTSYLNTIACRRALSSSRLSWSGMGWIGGRASACCRRPRICRQTLSRAVARLPGARR